MKKRNLIKKIILILLAASLLTLSLTLLNKSKNTEIQDIKIIELK